MKYDFDSIIDRHNKDSIAVDVIPFPGAEVVFEIGRASCRERV